MGSVCLPYYTPSVFAKALDMEIILSRKILRTRSDKPSLTDLLSGSEAVTNLCTPTGHTMLK